MRITGKLILLVAACLAGFHPALYGQSLPVTAPGKVGLSAERLARINYLVQYYVDKQKLAGAVTLVARRGQVVHFESVGMRDMEAGKPMELDTVFRIYSMTKPITSVAVMMLYEEGHFQLYEPVSRFIPQFKGLQVVEDPLAEEIELVDADREMTIHDLLTHTSGLTYGEGRTVLDALYREKGIMSLARTTADGFCVVYSNGNLEEMIQKLASVPLLQHPGDQWHYSVSTDVLGYLVQEVSGMPLDQFFAERIFKPLGMVDTGFHVAGKNIGRFAANYGIGENDAMQLIDAPGNSRFLSPPGLYSGGGGLVSTAADYYRFAQMLLNGGQFNGTRLLSRKSVELMTVNHLWGEYEEGYGFGLGFWVLEDVARTQELGSKGSYGWGGAATTWFMVDPQEELVALFLAQFMPYGYYPIAKQFKALTYQAIND